MLTRILAEERLRTITDGAIAAGSMDAREQRKVVRVIEKQAQAPGVQPAKANPAMLAKIGIGVTTLSEASEPSLNGIADGG